MLSLRTHAQHKVSRCAPSSTQLEHLSPQLLAAFITAAIFAGSVSKSATLPLANQKSAESQKLVAPQVLVRIKPFSWISTNE